MTNATEVEGTPAVGLYADVVVLVDADGSFTALKLEVEEEKQYELTKVEFEGPIEAIDGYTWTVAGYSVHLTGEATWQVGDQTISVNTHAEIEGEPQLWYIAEVEGWLSPVGDVLALEIEVDDDGEEEPDYSWEQRSWLFPGIVQALPWPSGAIDKPIPPHTPHCDHGLAR